MPRWVYMDGQFYRKEEARISVWDHGLLYGDGIFEGIRAYAGRVFRLDEHLKRLYESALLLWIQIPVALPELRELVLETLRRNGMADAYVRLVVTRGVGDLGLDPRKCHKPSLIIIVDRLSLYPASMYEKGLKLMIASTRKNSVDAVNPRVKSLNYLNNIVAKMEAIQAGLSEAVMLDRNGYLTECTAENLFLLQGGRLRTPAAGVGILEGVTRGAVMEIAAARGYPVEEALLTAHDLHIAEEAFVTGTGAEILPVVEVSGRPIGAGVPGPVTMELLEAYRELTHREGTPFEVGEAGEPASA